MRRTRSHRHARERRVMMGSVVDVVAVMMRVGYLLPPLRSRGRVGVGSLFGTLKRKSEALPLPTSPCLQGGSRSGYGSTTVIFAGVTLPMPRIAGRYMSSTSGGGTVYVPGVTARTR